MEGDREREEIEEERGGERKKRGGGRERKKGGGIEVERDTEDRFFFSGVFSMCSF